MKNTEEPKTLKELLIVGPGIRISNDIRYLFRGKDDCLIIGNGSDATTAASIRATLKKENFKITKDTRVDINAHSIRTNDKQHNLQVNSTNPEDILLTEKLFKGLREIAQCPLYVHLWSCYGGSANKAVNELGADSILVTHIESKLSSWNTLDNYSMKASLERYLSEDLTPYQQFILDSPENFGATTFNKVGVDGTIKQFKSTRMRTPKEKKWQIYLKIFLHKMI